MSSMLNTVSNRDVLWNIIYVRIRNKIFDHSFPESKNKWEI